MDFKARFFAVASGAQAAGGYGSAASSGTGEREPALPRWAPPALVAATTLLAYAATLRFGFVYDDRVQILNNPWLSSWQYVPRFFSENAAAFTGAAGGAFWRPLFLLWLLVNRAIFGTQPWGWHLTTVLLHCADAALVYGIARRAFRRTFPAVVAALLFGIYPATVETVAWVAGTTDSLLGIFFLGSFLLYLRAWERHSRVANTLSLLLYGFGLLVKETAVVLPVLVLAHAWLYRSEQPPDPARPATSTLRRLLRLELPYVVITAVYLVERSLVLGGAGEAVAAGVITLGTRAMALTWPSLLLFYLRMLVFPAPASAHYDLRAVDEFGVRAVLIPSLALVLIAFVALWSVGRMSAGNRRAALFSLVWMLAPILPVLYIRRMAADDFAHLRYLYLPSAGLALLAGVLLGGCWRGRRWAFGRPITQWAVLLALLAVCGATTARAQFHWRDDLALFSQSARVAPHNSRALTDYAIELGNRKQYQEAVGYFQRALALDPNLWYANVDLGYTYYLMGQYDEAEHYIQRGTEINPRDPSQYTYLAAAQVRAGKLDAAEASLRKAISLAPDQPGYHYALGLLLEREGKPQQAREAFRREIEINPRNAQAREKLEP